MKKLTIITCIVLFIAGITHAITPGDGKSCRKYEEALYLNTALNNPGGVTKYLDSLRACGNDSPETLLSLGRYLYNQKDYKGSEEALLQLIAHPASTEGQLGEGWYYYGNDAYYLKMYAEGMKRLLKSVKYGYKPYWCYNSIGLCLADSGAYKQAIEFYNLSIKSKPGYASAINNKGVAYDNLGNNELALKYYIMADSLESGKSALYRSNITRQYRDMEMNDKALASAQIGIKNFPNEWRSIYNMGNALNKKERYNDALKYAFRLQTMHASTADNWFDIAHLYDCGGRPDSALLFYRMSLRLKPDAENTNHNMGIIYRTMGLFDKADEHISRALEADPTDELVTNSKIQLYLWQHKYDEAYKWCLRYNELYPGGKYSYLNTGYVLLHLKKYAEAIPWLRLKLTQVADDDRALNNIGRCYAKLGMQDSAFFYFSKALSINPFNAYTYHNRASLYTDLGRYDLACADLENAIKYEYTWLIDSSLIVMKQKYCPGVNTNRKVIINEYRGNAKELNNRSFIELIDSISESPLPELELLTEITVPDKRDESGSAQSAFTIYPNPSPGLFTVEKVMWDEESLSLRIFDIQGRLVSTMPMQQQRTAMDLSAYGTGTYVVMVVSEDAVLSTQKVIVE